MPVKENWFTQHEYRRRLDAVRSEMSARGLDGLLVFSPANVYYLTGHHSIDSWEFRAAIISHDRPPALLLYEFERGRFEASSWLREANYYGPGDDTAALLKSIINANGLASAKVGVEINATNLTVDLHRRLSDALAETGLADVSRLVDEIRLTKSSEELACIERAAELTERGMCAAVQAAVEGAEDHAIAAAATDAMLRAGSHSLVMMPTVAVGERSGRAHSEHVGRTIRSGDSVFLELSGCWRHYTAPLMKTLHVGPPDEAWTRMQRVAHQTADAICEAARPGVLAREVAQAAHNAMRHVEQEVQFHYNFGYSIGASFPPHWLEESAFYLTEQNAEPLKAGMVFHLPLTFRILGKCASGTSRTIVIADDGVRVLTGREDS
jgi:Xaa-Pro aminopeptidase